MPSKQRSAPALQPIIQQSQPEHQAKEISFKALDTARIGTATPVSRPKTEPLAPGRYRLQFTVGEETYDKLRRVQDLLRHRLPNGDPAAIFDRALTVLLADLEKTKLAATAAPRRASSRAKRSRHVPAAVRRAVWARDGGRCRFEGPAGRCQETGFLEFHHVIPYADGGPAIAENLELRCGAHNRYHAEQWFGFVRKLSFEYEDGFIS